MTELQGEQRSMYVREMFGRIAGRYDLLNRVMTLGQDQGWRREAIRRLELEPSSQVLDIGAGTGDLALEARRRIPGALVVAADFTPEMIAVGRRRPAGASVRWVIADAHRLPFARETFDGVVSGFLLRNVAELDQALSEQRRVLREGGRLVSLDTTPPQPGALRPVLNFHLNRVVPWLGRVLAGDADAYRYLPSSTAGFLTAEALASRLSVAGFGSVSFARRMLGTVAIHWATKGTRP